MGTGRIIQVRWGGDGCSGGINRIVNVLVVINAAAIEASAKIMAFGAWEMLLLINRGLVF